jgi:hypothetical protein
MTAVFVSLRPVDRGNHLPPLLLSYEWRLRTYRASKAQKTA